MCWGRFGSWWDLKGSPWKDVETAEVKRQGWCKASENKRRVSSAFLSAPMPCPGARQRQLLPEVSSAAKYDDNGLCSSPRLTLNLTFYSFSGFLLSQLAVPWLCALRILRGHDLTLRRSQHIVVTSLLPIFTYPLDPFQECFDHAVTRKKNLAGPSRRLQAENSQETLHNNGILLLVWGQTVLIFWAAI